MLHLPWAENRPNKDDIYNCVELEMNIVNDPNSTRNITSTLVYDIECDVSQRCPICMIDKPVLKIYVRGLCKMLFFESEYNINDFF